MRSITCYLEKDAGMSLALPPIDALANAVVNELTKDGSLAAN